MPQDQEYEQTKAEAIASAYDSEAEATGWFGPEIAFGLVYEHLRPGQSVLDLGIGTGRVAALFRKAGLTVRGLDIAQEMLDASRSKGFDDLTRHDLTEVPYPYASESFDHVVCVGVLPFLSDLSPVFAETARLLRTGGRVVFMTLDRAPYKDSEFIVGPEHTKTNESVTMHRHSGAQIEDWLTRHGFALLRSLPFTAYKDAEKTEPMHARCYLARKAA